MSSNHGNSVLLEQEVAELKQELAAVFDLLVGSGILRGSQVAASIHKHRFRGVLQRWPCACSSTLTDLVTDPGILHPILRYAGIPAIGQVGACAQALKHNTAVSQRYAVSPARFYVLGGSTGEAGSTPLSSAFCFNVEESQWLVLPPMPTARDVLAAAACGGRIYAIGGKDGGRASSAVECYDPQDMCWYRCPPMSVARGGLGAAADHHTVFAVGGSDGRRALNVVERYDCRTNIWLRTSSLLTPRRGVAVTSNGGCLYALGGTDGNQVLSSVEQLVVPQGAPTPSLEDEGDQTMASWTELPPMLRPRRAASATCAGGRIFVTGGTNEMGLQGRCLESGEVYEPERSAWEPLPPMLVARRGLAALCVGDLIYVFGGSDGERCTQMVEVFDSVGGAWSAQPPLPQRCENFGAAATQTMEMLGLSMGPATTRFLPQNTQQAPSAAPSPGSFEPSLASSAQGVSRWG